MNKATVGAEVNPTVMGEIRNIQELVGAIKMGILGKDELEDRTASDNMIQEIVCDLVSIKDNLTIILEALKDLGSSR